MLKVRLLALNVASRKPMTAGKRKYLLLECLLIVINLEKHVRDALYSPCVLELVETITRSITFVVFRPSLLLIVRLRAALVATSISGS